MSPKPLHIDGRSGLTGVRAPDPAEEVIDGYDCFADDDEERIAGLHMHFEGTRPPRWVLEEWARDAKYNLLRPGLE